jgi:hypothetical protein
MPICSKCHQEKEPDLFQKDKRRKSGINSWCKECANKNSAKWRQQNPAKVKQCDKDCYIKYKLQRSIQNKERYLKNKSVYSNKNRLYYLNNKHKHNEDSRLYNKRRRAVDPLFLAICRLRHRISYDIRKMGYKKGSRTESILGATYELVVNWLEYTWFLNYGTEYSGQIVEIDHIIPISSAKTHNDLVKLSHFTNLQYLSPEDNRSKSNKI